MKSRRYLFIAPCLVLLLLASLYHTVLVAADTLPAPLEAEASPTAEPVESDVEIFLQTLQPLTGESNEVFPAEVTSCAAPVRIMPLGDSITVGIYGSGYLNNSGDPRPPELQPGYRQPLYLNLRNAGHSLDFVGSNAHGQQANPSFDFNHQAQSGIRDDQVAAQVYNWLVANPADVVLLHIGTNNLSESPDDVRNILNEIDRYEANHSHHITVVLARIINRVNHSDLTTTFNNNVVAMAQARVTDTIRIVDMENGAGINYARYPNNPAGDMADNLHPYDTGYAKMATTWLNDLKAFLPVCPVAPIIASSPITTATVGLAYSYPVIASGYPTMTYSLTTAPSGMTINATTGLISWNPGAAGTFAVTVHVTNSAGSNNQSFNVQVSQPPANSAPTITSTPVTTAVVGQPYIYDVNADGYPQPTYALLTKPTGMDINATTGLIAWTPATVGSFPVTVQATNSEGSTTQNFTITVNQIPVITSTAVTTAAAGQPYTYDVDAQGTPAPTYALLTSLPGMTINATTGLIAWTPGSGGVFNVTVRASNSAGHADQNFTITVTQTPTITSTAVTSAVVGQPYTYDVDAGGYPTPTYALLPGTAPAGMTINATTGLISWTPAGGGNFNVTVRASNSAGHSDQSFTITVAQSPTITSTPVTTGAVGQLYTYDVNASGHPTPTYTLTAAPAGMSINATTGLITWTPSTAGSFNVSVQAANSAGMATQFFTVTIIHTSVIIVQSPASQTLNGGAAATFNITVTNTSDTSLTSLQVSGHAAADCNRAVATSLAAGQSTTYTCARANIMADFSTSATVTAQYPLGQVQNTSNTVSVTVLPGILVTQTGPGSGTPGGTISMTVQVANTVNKNLTLTALTSNLFGDLTNPANPHLVATTCAAGAAITGGGAYTCSFTARLPQQSGNLTLQTTAAARDNKNLTATSSHNSLIKVGYALFLPFVSDAP